MLTTTDTSRTATDPLGGEARRGGETRCQVPYYASRRYLLTTVMTSFGDPGLRYSALPLYHLWAYSNGLTGGREGGRSTLPPDYGTVSN